MTSLLVVDICAAEGLEPYSTEADLTEIFKVAAARLRSLVNAE